MIGALLWWICGACVGSVIGNRADRLSLSAIKQIQDVLKRPENHDMAQTLAKSVFQSLKYFLKDLREANPFPNLEVFIDDCEDAIRWVDDVSKDPPPTTKQLVESLHDQLSPFLAYVDSNAKQAKREQVEQAISKGVIKWLELRAGTLPLLFRVAFENGIKTNDKHVEPWVTMFRDAVSNSLKENSRFQKIVVTELLAGTHQITGEIVAQLQTLESKLEFLTTFQDSLEWDRLLMLNSSVPQIVFEDSTLFNLSEPAGLSRQTLKLWRKYKLVFHNDLESGVVFGVQQVNGRWYPILLDADKNRFANVSAMGRFEFPPHDWLQEKHESDIGKRRIGIVVSSSKLPSEISDDFTVCENLDSGLLRKIAVYLGEQEQKVKVWYAEFDVVS